jgi:predicted nucleic acid-binding protein
VTRRLVVFDASVPLRAVLRGDEAAKRWIAELERRRIDGLAPDLICAEVANGLAVNVAHETIGSGDAAEALVYILALPLRLEGAAALALPALELVQRHRISAHDAFYLALAEAAEATLVTADRRLAAVATDVALLT